MQFWKGPFYLSLVFQGTWSHHCIFLVNRLVLINLCDSSVRDAKIAASERVKSGVTGEQLWLKINEPTEKDKGKYTMDIFDGKDGVKRAFELTGQGECELLKPNKEDF